MSGDSTLNARGGRTLAVVQGQSLTELPHDLYIPPEALKIFLEAFEGPLDLLLYLIQRQNLDILNIPIAEITEQYIRYINLMQHLDLDLVGEYLLMATLLAEIKSRMLLPKPAIEETDEADPRVELIRRLQQYEQYKQAAENLNALPRYERDLFAVIAEFPDRQITQKLPEVALSNLLTTLAEVLARADLYIHHQVQSEPLSVRERMTLVLATVTAERFTSFQTLFVIEEGRRGVIVTLLAILELLKSTLIEVVQSEIDGPIYVKAAL